MDFRDLRADRSGHALCMPITTQVHEYQRQVAGTVQCNPAAPGVLTAGASSHVDPQQRWESARHWIQYLQQEDTVVAICRVHVRDEERSHGGLSSFRRAKNLLPHSCYVIS